MANREVIKEIVLLPRKFYSAGDRSMYDLLEQSGYFQLYDEVTENGLREALLRDAKCIKEWIAWSDNKRTRFGWYFSQDAESKFVVGHMGSEKGKGEKMIYLDAIPACAAFIKREIEDIRASANS